jgi:hypothetical protein
MSKARQWNVDIDSTPGVLRCWLRGSLRLDEMRAFVLAHNVAVDTIAGKDYKVWVDLRGLAPLSPEATEIMEGAKRHSAKQRNFRGSAVLVDNAVIALQHGRTSRTGGVSQTEFTSNNEEACRRHLENIYRDGLTESSFGSRTKPLRRS